MTISSLFRLLLAGTLSASILGCSGMSGSGDSQSGAASNPDTPPLTQTDLFNRLQGTWRSPCLDNDSLTFLPSVIRQAFGSARNTMYVTQEDQTQLQMDIYSGSNCSGLIATLTATSEITARPHATILGRWEIDSRMVAATLAIDDILGAIAANGLFLFAYNDWAPDVARNVLDRGLTTGYAAPLRYGAMLYTIMDVNSTSLNMAAWTEAADGTTPETRQNVIDPAVWTQIP